MGDLEVATDELVTLSARLKSLSEDLKESDASVEYGRTELAHDKVIDAMGEFHSNWDNNRDYVCSKLDKLSGLAKQTSEGFDETEADLARQIAEAVDL